MNDEDIDSLLKSAGPREKPPAEIERAARDRLRAEWLAVVAARNRVGRRRTAVSIAAGILTAAVGVWVAAPRLIAPAETVATLTLATGDVHVNSGWLGGRRALVEGQLVSAGQTLETGSSGRAALALPGGISARMDRDTRMTIAGAGRLTLDRGALYVDAGPGADSAARLDVLTPSGSVRHVGTQYEVRLLDNGVQLRVREGRVEWRSRSGDIERTRSGEQLTISADGTVRRTPTPRYGPSWDWAAAAAPGIDIDGIPLTRFLAWAGRELGREVTYASSQVESDAEGIVVHGSIAGLVPMQALEAVLATTSVRAAVIDDLIVVGAEETVSTPGE